MFAITELDFDQFEACAHEAGIRLPIEQTKAWSLYQDSIEGRSPWGCLRIDEGGEVLGLVSFIEYHTHGYRYLRSAHGPVWARPLSPDEEHRAIEEIRDFVAKRDRHQVFLRMAVENASDVAAPVLSTLPYDTTVIIDVTGGEDAILSRMKPRGRRDVRKSLRECPADCADETEYAAQSFAEYHRIMVETGERDGFIPAPESDFLNMIHLLGRDHCRVYAARCDKELLAWSLVTFNDGRATRYYAATTHNAGRLRVADKLVLFECECAAELGCDAYDLMGIGSEFAPETMNLNEFKTKFAKEGVCTIAPDRDVPVRRTMYRALVAAKRLRDGGKEK